MKEILNNLTKAVRDGDYAKLIEMGLSAKLKIDYDKPAKTLKLPRNLYQTMRNQRNSKIVKKVYIKCRKDSVQINIILRTNYGKKATTDEI